MQVSFLVSVENWNCQIPPPKKKRQLVTFSAQISKFKKCGQVGKASSKYPNSPKQRGRSKPRAWIWNSPHFIDIWIQIQKSLWAPYVQKGESKPCPNHLSFLLPSWALKMCESETKSEHCFLHHSSVGRLFTLEPKHIFWGLSSKKAKVWTNTVNLSMILWDSLIVAATKAKI